MVGLLGDQTYEKAIRLEMYSLYNHIWNNILEYHESSL